jgi:hypothetical protein
LAVADRWGRATAVLPASCLAVRLGGSPGSRVGGGTSGRGLPGGLSGGGTVGCPGVAGGISGGSIGITINTLHLSPRLDARRPDAWAGSTTARALRRSCAPDPRNFSTIDLVDVKINFTEEDLMRKTALVLATAGALGVASIAAPAPAEARGGWGWGGAVAGGLLAGAVIGGIASSAYAWGPGYPYGYYGGYPYGYYGGYAPAYAWGGPAYYGAYAYDDVYTAPAYTTVTYGYAPSYYRYRRVVRPAYAYYRGPGPRYYVHHRWHRRY